TITVESLTFTGNSAVGGAAIASGNRNVVFAADIFAKQASGTNCYFSVCGPSVDGGYKVYDDATWGLISANHSVSDSKPIDHYLGSLADSGGPAQPVALLKT